MNKRIREGQTFRDLAALNRRFLVLAMRGVPGPVSVGGPVIAGLGREARERLSSLPFALFSFGFGEDPRWDELRDRGVRDAEAAGPAPDRAKERFALLALAFLREGLLQEPSRVAAIGGVPQATGAWLAELEFGELLVLAPTASSCLRWRLPGHSRFWAELVAACSGPNEAVLPVLRATAIQWTIRRALALGEQDCRSSGGFRVRDGDRS